jgi:curved DNA-binding protein CbpA
MALNHFKDHYKILGLEPGSPPALIKKAWRKLVQQHHPDKTGNIPSSLTAFQDIQEAYETLTDPVKKQKYLQQRWLQQVTREETIRKPETAEDFLHACLQLEQKIASANTFRIDEDYLMQYLFFLLTPSHLAILNSTKENDLLSTCLSLLLKSIEPLPVEKKQIILQEMEKINTTATTKQISEYRKNHRSSWFMEQYGFYVMIILSFLLCWLIASLAK